MCVFLFIMLKEPLIVVFSEFCSVLNYVLQILPVLSTYVVTDTSDEQCINDNGHQLSEMA